MNYTTIVINGKEYGLRFGMACVLDMDGVEFKDTILYTSKLIISGHRNFCIVKEIEPALKLEDVYNYVESIAYSQDDNEDVKQVKRIMDMFADTLKPLTGTDKKKQAVKKSKNSHSAN